MNKRQQPKPKKKPKKARKVRKPTTWLERAKKRDPDDVALINGDN